MLDKFIRLGEIEGLLRDYLPNVLENSRTPLNPVAKIPEKNKNTIYGG